MAATGGDSTGEAWDTGGGWDPGRCPGEQHGRGVVYRRVDDPVLSLGLTAERGDQRGVVHGGTLVERRARDSTGLGRAEASARGMLAAARRRAMLGAGIVGGRWVPPWARRRA